MKVTAMSNKVIHLEMSLTLKSKGHWHAKWRLLSCQTKNSPWNMKVTVTLKYEGHSPWNVMFDLYISRWVTFIDSDLHISRWLWPSYFKVTVTFIFQGEFFHLQIWKSLPCQIKVPDLETSFTLKCKGRRHVKQKYLSLKCQGQINVTHLEILWSLTCQINVTHLEMSLTL